CCRCTVCRCRKRVCEFDRRSSRVRAVPHRIAADCYQIIMSRDRKVVHTRHVLAVKDLKIETDYYTEKLGFKHDFSAPGWEFLSFGIFKVMLGECADEMTAEATGNHSW